MIEKITVSAIIPTFNGEKYIRDTIESILAQSHVPDEVVLSDDRSTDSTISIIQQLSENSKTPIRLVIANQTGISNNYFNAISHARGNIIIVGDHDDIWKKDRVSKVLSAFKENPETLLVCSDSVLVDDGLNDLNSTLRGGFKKSLMLASLSDKDCLKQFIQGLRFDAHTLAFKKELNTLAMSHAFAKHEHFWFESKMVLACMALGGFKYLPDSLTLYRQHSNQHTRQPSSALQANVPKAEGAFSREAEIELLIQSLRDENPVRVIDEHHRQARINTLVEYRNFLDVREVKSSLSIISNMFSGKYHLFTRRSFLSFAKDLLASFR